MDFNKYYLDQANGIYPVFKGPPIQKGYGIGNAFRKFISWAIPLLKQHALPVAKEVGKHVIQNIAEIANDAIEGKSIKDSAKEKMKSSIEKLNQQQQQQGRGKRKIRKIKNKNKKKKSKKDIFD